MTELPDIEVARYALRTFSIDRVCGTLKSVSLPGDHWVGGACIAQCLREEFRQKFGSYLSCGEDPGPHTSPPKSLDTNCDCGIYGANTADHLYGQYPRHCRELIAVIAAEGNTLIGDVGLRTAAARVVAYWSPSQEVRRICVDACPGAKAFTALDAMLADYGFEPATRLTPERVEVEEEPRPTSVSIGQQIAVSIGQQIAAHIKAFIKAWI